MRSNDDELVELRAIYRLGKWVFGTFGVGIVGGFVTLTIGLAHLANLELAFSKIEPIVSDIPLVRRDVAEIKETVKNVLVPRVETLWYSRTNYNHN